MRRRIHLPFLGAAADAPFPALDQAWSDPNGLLAMGGLRRRSGVTAA